MCDRYGVMYENVLNERRVAQRGGMARSSAELNPVR
jgi:hypothetical protein